MNYTLKRIIKTLTDDMKDGLTYLCEAFDEYGELVNVKMTEEDIENGGIFPNNQSPEYSKEKPNV